ncbi:MAG: hypothetical protein R3C25_07575 [Hyphomonadaceae bacterium]
MARSLPSAPTLARPRLDLSGPTLLAALERVISGCEQSNGVEGYVEALKLRGIVFQQTFARAAPNPPDVKYFMKLAAFMPTVRRRIGPYLEPSAYPAFANACVALISARHDPLAVDERIAAFTAFFPRDNQHRWVRDLAAELLHAVDPERYPLMCRWIWDAKANTGVLREIWHGDIDRETLHVEDGYATFVMLREELSQFLASNGIFQNVLYYVDLLCAQVYAEYVSAQGGSYLRADFSSADDPIHYVRRLLGLDGVRVKGDVSEPQPGLLQGNSNATGGA